MNFIFYYLNCRVISDPLFYIMPKIDKCDYFLQPIDGLRDYRSEEHEYFGKGLRHFLSHVVICSRNHRKKTIILPVFCF